MSRRICMVICLISFFTSVFGTTYIRWSRNVCPNNTELVYAGYVGGGHWEHFWSAAEPVCRPPDPDFTNSSGSPYHGCMCGAEFYSNFFAPDSQYQDLPCAVCSFPQATSVIMIPGKNTCYQGWNQEYNDFLSTNHYANPAAGKNKNSKTFRSSTVSCRNHSFNIHTQNVKDIVTVTGGSGFLGQHIIRTLQERADYVSEIRVLDIVPYKNLLGHRETKPVIMYQGSVTDRQTTTTAFCGATSVIHVAGLISFGTFPDVSAMKRINIDGTGNVIQTCLECNVERLVFCSSVDVVIGHKEIDHGNETLRIPKKFLFPGYPKTKFKAERLVRMASGETCKNGSHLRTISLRANVMYGELDPYYVTNGLQSAKDNRGILYQVGDGRSQFQQTYVGNTAWAFVCADKALKKNAINSGEFFFVPDNTPIQNTFQFMEIFLKGRNYKLSKYKIPFSIVYYPVLMLEWFLHVLSPLVRIYLPIVSCSIKYINMNLHFSGKKARERLGYHPIYKPNESIEKCLDFYQNVKLK